MLSQKQIEEIRIHLEKSQNPVFFFDDDVDGLCSFLLLARAIERGKGVSIKSFPGLNIGYLRKINELNPDYIFILDKPIVDNDFINAVLEKNIPIVWIDHHDIEINPEIKEKINYYNSSPSSEPVTYIAYNIFKKEQDIWLAMIGCIGDAYLPDFAEKFAGNHPDMFIKRISAFDAIYMTEIGRAVTMLNFALKDTTTNVVRMQKFLIKINSIYDLFEENSNTRQIHKKYSQLKKILDNLIKRAELSKKKSKILFFTYSGGTSMSSELSNALKFRHPKKSIIIAYKNQEKANISARGDNIKKLILKSIETIPGATGGGHEKACGARIPIDFLDDFKKNIEKFSKDF